MRVGWDFARPQARHGSETFALRWGPVSIPATFVTVLQPNWSHAAKSSQVCIDLHALFVASLGWLHSLTEGTSEGF